MSDVGPACRPPAGQGRQGAQPGENRIRLRRMSPEHADNLSPLTDCYLIPCDNSVFMAAVKNKSVPISFLGHFNKQIASPLVER